MDVYDRIPYSAIVNRKPLKLPDDGRVIVWPVVNLEEWVPTEPLPRRILTPPGEGQHVPDIPNWCWYEYGMRIGVWRLMEVLKGLGITPTVSLNATVVDVYPEVAEAALKADWEFLGHSYVQKAMFLLDDEREAIFKTAEHIKNFCGYQPRGWMGPGLAETFDTPDILADEGIEYVADWCNDDQPYEMKVKNGRLVAVPYTLELNDIPIYIVQHHRSSEIFERARDQFDTLYREGGDSARIMCISTHPYITGVPHRIKYYDMIFEYLRKFEGVLFMTGSEILDWYNSTVNE